MSSSHSLGIRLTIIGAIMLVLMAAGALLVGNLPRSTSNDPNLVLIVLDTVRYDHTSLGSSRATTPFLKDLAGSGVEFTSARSAAEWTMPSHASIFTGLLPHQHLCTFEHRYLPDEVVTIAERLRQKPYRTAAFSSNVNVSRVFNFDQGFDHFFEAFNESATLAYGSRSAALLADLERWLGQSRNEPVFLFVNLMEAHLPYEATAANLATFAPRGQSLDPKELGARDFFDRVLAGERRLDDEFKSALAERYDAALHTVDDRLRDVIEMLGKSHIDSSNTIFVITSDHGEHLGEGGLVDHHGSLSEELLRVPLVIYGRGVAAGKKVASPVSTANIARWLDVLPSGGFKPDRYSAQGAIVSERTAEPEIVARLAANRPGVDHGFLEFGESAIVDSSGRWKLVHRDDGAAMLYELGPGGATLIDPTAEPEVRTRLSQSLATIVRTPSVVERFDVHAEFAPDNDALTSIAQSGYGSPASVGSTASIHAQIHLERGNRSLTKGDLAEAKKDYEAALAIEPRFAAAYFNLAVIAEKSNAPTADQKRAWERYVDIALRTTPDDQTSIQQAYQRLEALR